MSILDSAGPLEAIDALLASAGLRHGRRQRRSADSTQARTARREGPAHQEKEQVQPANVQPVRAGVLEEAGVRHGFSTRSGGVSTAYGQAGELNLGFTASDEREHVVENRARLVREVFAREMPLVTLRQRHSTLVRRVGRGDAEYVLTGDGLMTDEPGLALGVQTADCVPVLLADPKWGAVAAIHAGWRGTLRRIVENTVGRMRLEFGSMPEDLVAAIGPAIGACCYAVGEEVESEFHSQFAYSEELFCDVNDADPVRKKYPMLFLSQRAPGHTEMGPSRHLDLAEANRRQLLDAGLRPASIEVSGLCTSCRTDLFFSYRAEAGFTGRMLAVIAAG